MKLQAYLDNTVNCEVIGHCATCGKVGILDRIPAHPCLHVMYRCPSCCSINVVIYKVSEPTEDGNRIIIYERK